MSEKGLSFVRCLGLVRRPSLYDSLAVAILDVGMFRMTFWRLRAGTMLRIEQWASDEKLTRKADPAIVWIVVDWRGHAAGSPRYGTILTFRPPPVFWDATDKGGSYDLREGPA